MLNEWKEWVSLKKEVCIKFKKSTKETENIKRNPPKSCGAEKYTNLNEKFILQVFT